MRSSAPNAYEMSSINRALAIGAEQRAAACHAAVEGRGAARLALETHGSSPEEQALDIEEQEFERISDTEFKCTVKHHSFLLKKDP